MFWLLAALLTLAATLAILVPISRSGRPNVVTEPPDVAIYRDQLAELDADRDRGLIDEASAAEARGEIGRRLIGAAKMPRPHGPRRSGASRWLAFASVLFVPLVSWGLYGEIGSPLLPAEPFAARLERRPTQDSIQELLARAENHLETHPDDGRGWDVLAPVYLRIGAFEKAVAAYRNAIRLLGSTAQRQTGLGEAITAEAGGNITPDAVAAFTEAAKLDGSAIDPRFFLASGLAQQGKLDDAEAAFKAIEPLAAKDARWAGRIASALGEIGKRRQGAASGGMPGPTTAEVAAAGQMTGEQRQSMIEGMVARLDMHLKSDPGDVDGWKRLLRSYVVLGQNDKARDALARGSSAIANAAGADARTNFEEFAKGLGVTSAGGAQ